MKRTIVVCSTHGGLKDGTRLCLAALQARGAEYIEQRGSADVAYARNMALTGALRYIATRNKEAAAPTPSSMAMQRGDATPPPEPIDTILMLDDDMFFTVEQAQELIDHSRKTGVGASAMYSTLNGSLAATRLYTEPGNEQRWLVGLGLLAVPLALLQEVGKRSKVFESFGSDHVEFCWTGELGGTWVAEDYCLTRRMGGVHLLPMGVGHIKPIPLYPHEESITCIREGRRLPGDLDSKILENIPDPLMLEHHGAKR